MLKWKAKNNLCGKSYQRAQTHFLYTDDSKERTKYLSILGVLDSRHESSSLLSNYLKRKQPLMTYFLVGGGAQVL